MIISTKVAGIAIRLIREQNSNKVIIMLLRKSLPNLLYA